MRVFRDPGSFQFVALPSPRALKLEPLPRSCVACRMEKEKEMGNRVQE